MQTHFSSIQQITTAPFIEPRRITMNFVEGTRECTEEELRNYDITRYQVTKFYQEQIRKSGYYEQLKHIVEPSLKEFSSPGTLDTSGEHDHTVLPGLQHKYPQTGLLLVTDRCASLWPLLLPKADRRQDIG